MKLFPIAIAFGLLSTIVVCKDCTFFDNFVWHYQETRTDISPLIFRTPEQCCEACLKDSTCLVWNWSKNQSICTLFDRFGNLLFDLEHGYVSGELIKNQEATTPPVEIKSASSSSKSSAVVSIGPTVCKGEDNTFYKKAKTYASFPNIEESQCCFFCRLDTRCFSWNWEKKENRCMLNEAPGTKTTRNGFTGASNL